MFKIIISGFVFVIEKIIDKIKKINYNLFNWYVPVKKCWGGT
ncbi:MAG: hypothetical protein ACRC8M_08270 [Cetobacterium sp.]